jgi:hypothetical protein
MVSKRGFEPPPLIQGLAPQASASANSATRTRRGTLTIGVNLFDSNPIKRGLNACRI